MTNPNLALEGVAFALADGRTLFAGVDLQLDERRTGLVGRNGVGKSVLAAILAGRLAPAAGRRVGTARVHYLPQLVAPASDATVASLAGVAPVLRALARIESGGVDPVDFETVGECWDIRQRLQAALHDHDLGHLHAEDAAARLSGGEQTRVALLGAWLSDADVLVLDEPSNHLDCERRAALGRALRDWHGGLLAVSHDRTLLAAMQRIVELSPQGLRDYGGDYAFYAGARAHERRHARDVLEHREAARRRGEAELRAQQERQQRRQSRAARQARDANQAKILLGGMKARAEVHAGVRRRQREARAEALARDVREAAQSVEDEVDVVLFPPRPSTSTRRRVASLEQAVLPYGLAGGAPLDLYVMGGQRIGVIGANGSGKSTLLKLLAGRLDAVSGRVAVHVPAALLDQVPDAGGASPLQALQDAHPGAAPSDLRTRLALLGLGADTAVTPVCRLSGGERLKAALARALYRREPAELLLLDEPTNHLDLYSIEALERTLAQYPGAMLVVSHDTHFLDALQLDACLRVGPEGWKLERV